MNRKWMQLGISLMFFIGAFWFSREALSLVQNLKGEKTVAIDPGHGGFDGGFTPGSIDGREWLEKEINLSISLILREKLEKAGYKVVMTRETDEGLYSEGDSNKKRSDMQKRVGLINESGADIAVSIHQNSFREESSKGAQTFYYPSSLEAKKLAEAILEKIKEAVRDGNHRVAKSNESYYMLKNTLCPLVIVECGFLSNYEEAQLLVTPEYQEKIAEGIFLGIEAYFSNPVH
ncbi:MAG: N-acetylmuramoyl-L-alanine amidase [Acetivibrio ethanolgignens]